MNPNTTLIHSDNIGYNISLLYDLNRPIEPKLWDGNFHPISLHGSIEHLISDAKSIKDSLAFMAKYMGNKQLNSTRSNKIEDFKGIEKAIWSFISSVYQAKWNMLTADKNSNSLRQKILDKLIPRVIPPTNCNNKPVKKSTLATINKMLPPIPAKSQKEVNQISKYSKNNKLDDGPSNSSKLYVQASKQSSIQTSKSANNTLEVIKIKDTFPTLNAQKVNQIHKIVTESPKPKLQIQMTTKGPSRKQVIIPISSNNISKFMKNSLLHVTSIN